MRTKQVDILLRNTPIPLAALITTAKSFDCDIYVDCGQCKINVKNYDEMKQGLNIRNRRIIFYFNGNDEEAAEGRIEMMFKP